MFINNHISSTVTNGTASNEPDWGLKPAVIVLLVPEISAAESLELSLNVSAISRFSHKHQLPSHPSIRFKEKKRRYQRTLC